MPRGLRPVASLPSIRPVAPSTMWTTLAPSSDTKTRSVEGCRGEQLARNRSAAAKSGTAEAANQKPPLQRRVAEPDTSGNRSKCGSFEAGHGRTTLDRDNPGWQAQDRPTGVALPDPVY